MLEKGLLLVLSGPAGSGKSTIAESVIKKNPECYMRSVTATTRKPRMGETDGVDYFFMNRDEFEKKISGDGFIEYTEFNGNLYGTPKDVLEKNLAKDKVVILVIEVEGAANIKKNFANAVHVFVLPPTEKDLRRRLSNRGTENFKDIENRLEIAKKEIERIKNYDYLIINDSLEAAVEDLDRIARVMQSHHIRGGEKQAWLDNAYDGWHKK